MSVESNPNAELLKEALTKRNSDYAKACEIQYNLEQLPEAMALSARFSRILELIRDHKNNFNSQADSTILFENHDSPARTKLHDVGHYVDNLEELFQQYIKIGNLEGDAITDMVKNDKRYGITEGDPTRDKHEYMRMIINMIKYNFDIIEEGFGVKKSK